MGKNVYLFLSCIDVSIADIHSLLLDLERRVTAFGGWERGLRKGISSSISAKLIETFLNMI